MEETDSCRSLTSSTTKETSCGTKDSCGTLAMPAMTYAWPKKADVRFQVRTLCLLGALLPGIGCYMCIAYTYIFQIDKVLNFTSAGCDNVKSTFPPVSYSIGVWKPQKFFWLFVLCLHLPPRVFFGVMYKNLYSLGKSESKKAPWYNSMVRYSTRLMVFEAMGLVAVSVIDIESYFTVHAVCYTWWIVTFNFNMMFNCLLHHFSGARSISEAHERIFYVKCVVWAVAYPLSVSTGISYGLYALHCSGLAYMLFSIAEYIIVGCNSLFYFLLIWEMTGSRIELHMQHDDLIPHCHMSV